MTAVFLGLGTNLGQRRDNLRRAVERLAPQVAVERLSSIYETEPAYVVDQPRFLNMALRGDTRLAPAALLRHLKAIERQVGRTPTVRYGPRVIDLDILLYGDEQIEEPGLTVPHARLTERAFVLVPLAEIAPDLIVPGQGQTVAALAQACAGGSQVVRVESPFTTG